MTAWWNSLGTFSQVFACMAIPATLLLVIQTVLMLIGVASEGADISDTDADVDVDGDPGNGIFGHDALHGDSDPSGLEGLRIFSFRGIIAFFVVFGWTGMMFDSFRWSHPLSVFAAFLCGFAVMVLLAVLFRAVYKLQDNGNIDVRNAVGVSGTVYLTVPAARSGEGKVNIMLQGAYSEMAAVTDDSEPIPTGSEIVVISLSGQNTLVVKRK